LKKNITDSPLRVSLVDDEIDSAKEERARKLQGGSGSNRRNKNE